jgi:hypothetical protein
VVAGFITIADWYYLNRVWDILAFSIVAPWVTTRSRYRLRTRSNSSPRSSGLTNTSMAIIKLKIFKNSEAPRFLPLEVSSPVYRYTHDNFNQVILCTAPNPKVMEVLVNGLAVDGTLVILALTDKLTVPCGKWSNTMNRDR